MVFNERTEKVIYLREIFDENKMDFKKRTFEISLIFFSRSDYYYNCTSWHNGLFSRTIKVNKRIT